jgi:predicted lipoprotein with Yx(FWY)xxD motif
MLRITALSCLAATATPTATPTRRPAPRGVTVRAVRSQFGTILANDAGKAFYRFDKERSKQSECYGDCAAAWPPVLTKGQRSPRPGCELGCSNHAPARRATAGDLSQARPMYYYVADAPGLVLCHNVLEFGARWLVVKPNGQPVR